MQRAALALTRPTRDTAQALAFSWIDTKEVRPSDSRAYAVLNDVDRQVSMAVLEALQSYDVKPVLWSQKDEIRQELAA